MNSQEIKVVTNGHHKDTKSIIEWVRKRARGNNVVALNIDWRGDYQARVNGRIEASTGRVGKFTAIYSLKMYSDGSRDHHQIDWVPVGKECPITNSGEVAPGCDAGNLWG